VSQSFCLHSTNQVISQIKGIIPIPIISSLSLGQLDLPGRAENPTYDSGNSRKVDYQISPFHPDVVGAFLQGCEELPSFSSISQWHRAAHRLHSLTGGKAQ